MRLRRRDLKRTWANWVGMVALAVQACAQQGGLPGAPPAGPGNVAAVIAPEDEVLVPVFYGLLITTNQADPDGIPPRLGLEVRGVELLQRDDFKEIVRPYFFKPVTKRMVSALADSIILYCRDQGHQLVDVIYYPQLIHNGMMQLRFLEGRLKEVKLQDVNRHPYTNGWSSTNWVRKQVTSPLGKPITTGRLVNDLDWLNRNPFREVKVVFEPGGDFGESDLLLRIEDKLPVKTERG